MSGIKWGSDDPDDVDDQDDDALPVLVDEPDRDIPDRYSSVDAGGDLCIYDSDNHQAWVQSSVGISRSDCR